MSLGIEMSGKRWLHGPDEADTVGRMTGLEHQLAKDKAYGSLFEAHHHVWPEAGMEGQITGLSATTAAFPSEGWASRPGFPAARGPLAVLAAIDRPSR